MGCGIYKITRRQGLGAWKPLTYSLVLVPVPLSASQSTAMWGAPAPGLPGYACTVPSSMLRRNEISQDHEPKREVFYHSNSRSHALGSNLRLSTKNTLFHATLAGPKLTVKTRLTSVLQSSDSAFPVLGCTMTPVFRVQYKEVRSV